MLPCFLLLVYQGRLYASTVGRSCSTPFELRLRMYCQELHER